MFVAAASRLRAAIALATMCLLVASGVLSRQHEAEVTHVTDASTGLVSHALDSNCHDSAPITHIHALPGDDHADVCSLTAALHQPVTFAQAVPLVTQLLVIERATAPPIAIHAHVSLLHSAPKTSPPSLV